jgi:LPS export ABC transporter permease LptG
VILLALACTGATLYVMIQAIPDANQTFREITFEIVSKRAENEVRPRVFYEDFPGWVLYARDEPPSGGGWKDVLVADTRKPNATVLFLASRGRLIVNREKRTVELVLTDGTRYSAAKPGETEIYAFQGTPGRPSEFLIVLDPQTVFGKIDLPRGITEKTIAELRKDADDKRRSGVSTHNEVMYIQQKFSIPVACLVFAVIGLALGLTVAREGKLGGFVLGIGVIFAYYVAMYLSEALTKGAWMPAILARWVPNILLGVAGVIALVWRARWAERGLPLPLGISRLLARWQPGSTPAVRGAAAGSRVVVVVRLPRLRLPLPGLLDRYVSRIYLRVVGLAFLALLGLFYISTFIDRSDKLFKGQATTGMLASLLVYLTPQFVYYVIPIAALLSVLVTFGILARSSELTVMKACGVSLYRLALPLVILSLVWSAVLFALEQEILGRANRRAFALDDTIKGRPQRTISPLNRRWIIGRDGSIYHYGYYDPRQKSIFGLSIYRLDPKAWRLAMHTFASRAQFDRAWIGDTGWTEDFSSRPPTWKPFSRQPVKIESPDYFETEHTDVELMTVPQLRKYVAELAASGFNHIPPAVELQQKLAFPLVTFVMTLLAVPFGVTTGRRGTLYGIGLGVVIALSYWVVSSVFIAIGKAGLLSPELAGWTPNIIVVAIALYLILTART